GSGLLPHRPIHVPRSHRMTPLRQRMIEDMRIRNFATTTQRSYVHYVAEFAKYFNLTPERLDLEAVRQYQLYLSQERKLSTQSISTFVSAVQFLFLVTLEMPWKKEDFPRPRVEEKLPVVLAPEEVQHFFDNLERARKARRPVDLLWFRAPHLRSGVAQSLRRRQPTHAPAPRTRQGRQGPLHHVVCHPAVLPPRLLPHPASGRPLAVSLSLGPPESYLRRHRADRLP